MFLDHVNIRFYDSPSDPDLGTNKFGLPPLWYEVYADPSGSLPDTRIATFFPGDGEETVVPQNPTRTGEVFEFDWTGLPLWNSNQLQAISTNFRVVAYNYDDYLSVADQTAQDTDTGKIAGLSAPDNFSATNGLFSDKIRVTWRNASNLEPDSYILQFQGEYDNGWTDVTPQPIPHSPGDDWYDYYVTGAAGAPDSGKFKIRAQKDGAGYSPWTEWDFGWAGSNGMHTPSYGMNWWTEDQGGGTHHVKVSLGSPAFGSIVPDSWDYDFYRGTWYGYTGSNSFNREAGSRIHTVPYSLVYTADTLRSVKVRIKWTVPGQYSNPGPTYYGYYQLNKTSSVPVSP